MLISEFITQLQTLYDIEGNLEIVMFKEGNRLGVTPSVSKDSFYEQFVISEE